MELTNTLNELIRFQGLIGGQWQDAEDGKTYEVRNPATGELITTVPDMGMVETRKAIEVAEKAQRVWRRMTAKQRSQALKRWALLIEKHANDLAVILTKEQGKSIADATGEVMSSSMYIDWFANEVMRINGELLPASAPGNFEFMQKRPVGVVGAITPWNFPNSMIARKIAPALAAGCAVVVKPAEDTPLSALALALLAEAAGIPAGVVNVVTASTGHEVGKELCANPIVRKLSFTGSTAVGKILYEQCASTVKKLSLELGGNAPFIVFDDADIELAVQGALTIKFYNTGQTCICANRIFVHADIHDEFVKKFNEAIDSLQLGNGIADGTTHGPLINNKAIQKITQLVDRAKAQGAQVIRGGQKREDLGENFFDFTILTKVNAEMDIFHSEIFGPVAPIYTFTKEDEVIELANRTNYGLAAYLYTNKASRILRLSTELEYGMVGVNTPRFISETVPFGGVKESGLGREGSTHGIDEFLEMHYVCINNQ